MPGCGAPLGAPEEAVLVALRGGIGIGEATEEAGSPPSRGKTEAQPTSAVGRVDALPGFSTRHADARPAGSLAPTMSTAWRPASTAGMARASATRPSPTREGIDTSPADESARLTILGRPPCTRR